MEVAVAAVVVVVVAAGHCILGVGLGVIIFLFPVGSCVAGGAAAGHFLRWF